MKSNNLKDLFKNIQDGTVLAFYRTDFIGSVIPFFTREKKSEIAPHHVAIVYQVKREVNTCSFKVSEQTFHGGQYRDVVITKFGDKYYITDKYFLKQAFIKMFKINMTQEQINLGINDAINQINKKYGYSRLVFATEIIEKILPKEFKRNLFLRLNKKETVRMCSLHVPMNLKKAGFNILFDDIYSPLEVIKLIEKL